MNLKEIWISLKDECASNKTIFSERRYLNRVKEVLTDRQWEKIKCHIDRREAVLPHHFRPDWNPKDDEPKVRAWRQARYELIFGIMKCETCDAKEGPIFTKIKNSGPHMNTIYRYCSASCSKASEHAVAGRRRTCLALYGVDNVSRSAHFRTTMKNHYANASEEWHKDRKDKKEATRIEKYGSLERYEKIRARKMVKTNNLRYGGNCSTCDPKVRRKVKATVRERYGVDNVSQSPEIMAKIIAATGNRLYERKSVRVKGRLYENLQGYEPAFVKWYHKQVGRPALKTHCVSVPYKHAGKQRYFHPDFEVEGENVLIEVKSVYTAGLCTNSGGYGSYTVTKAKFQGAVNVGYRIYLAIWNERIDAWFIREGSLPAKKLLKAEYDSWLKEKLQAA
jgi:hypothetical protein